MRTTKKYVSVDNVYNHDYNWGARLGHDCAFRALQVQGKLGLDINFGIIICKNKITTNKEFSVGNGYVLPYGWHVWNEDDDKVYDSQFALKAAGLDVSQIDSVLTIEAPVIKTVKQFYKYLLSLAKSFNPIKSPSLIYISGIGKNVYNQLMNEDAFNDMLDGIDTKFNLTGTTTNNIVVNV